MQYRFKPSKKWRAAYNALYGKGEVEQLDFLPPPAAVKKKPVARTEATEQIILARWLDDRGLPFYHIPNGGQRDIAEAAKFKRMGVKAGVPDICLCIARGAYHGLYIELKRVSGGSLSEAQIAWSEVLFANGYFWACAKGAEEAIKIVEDYLRLGATFT